MANKQLEDMIKNYQQLDEEIKKMIASHSQLAEGIRSLAGTTTVLNNTINSTANSTSNYSNTLDENNKAIDDNVKKQKENQIALDKTLDKLTTLSSTLSTMSSLSVAPVKAISSISGSFDLAFKTASSFEQSIFKTSNTLRNYSREYVGLKASQDSYRQTLRQIVEGTQTFASIDADKIFAQLSEGFTGVKDSNFQDTVKNITMAVGNLDGTVDSAAKRISTLHQAFSKYSEVKKMMDEISKGQNLEQNVGLAFSLQQAGKIDVSARDSLIEMARNQIESPGKLASRGSAFERENRTRRAAENFNVSYSEELSSRPIAAATKDLAKNGYQILETNKEAVAKLSETNFILDGVASVMGLGAGGIGNYRNNTGREGSNLNPATAQTNNIAKQSLQIAQMTAQQLGFSGAAMAAALPLSNDSVRVWVVNQTMPISPGVQGTNPTPIGTNNGSSAPTLTKGGALLSGIKSGAKFGGIMSFAMGGIGAASTYFDERNKNLSTGEKTKLAVAEGGSTAIGIAGGSIVGAIGGGILGMIGGPPGAVAGAKIGSMIGPMILSSFISSGAKKILNKALGIEEKKPEQKDEKLSDSQRQQAERLQKLIDKSNKYNEILYQTNLGIELATEKASSLGNIASSLSSLLGMSSLLSGFYDAQIESLKSANVLIMQGTSELQSQISDLQNDLKNTPVGDKEKVRALQVEIDAKQKAIYEKQSTYASNLLSINQQVIAKATQENINKLQVAETTSQYSKVLRDLHTVQRVGIGMSYTDTVNVIKNLAEQKNLHEANRENLLQQAEQIRQGKQQGDIVTVVNAALKEEIQAKSLEKDIFEEAKAMREGYLEAMREEMSLSGGFSSFIAKQGYGDHMFENSQKLGGVIEGGSKINAPGKFTTSGLEMDIAGLSKMAKKLNPDSIDLTKFGVRLPEGGAQAMMEEGINKVGFGGMDKAIGGEKKDDIASKKQEEILKAISNRGTKTDPMFVDFNRTQTGAAVGGTGIAGKKEQEKINQESIVPNAALAGFLPAKEDNQTNNKTTQNETKNYENLKTSKDYENDIKIYNELKNRSEAKSKLLDNEASDMERISGGNNVSVVLKKEESKKEKNQAEIAAKKIEEAQSLLESAKKKEENDLLLSSKIGVPSVKRTDEEELRLRAFSLNAVNKNKNLGAVPEVDKEYFNLIRQTIDEKNKNKTTNNAMLDIDNALHEDSIKKVKVAVSPIHAVLAHLNDEKFLTNEEIKNLKKNRLKLEGSKTDGKDIGKKHENFYNKDLLHKTTYQSYSLMESKDQVDEKEKTINMDFIKGAVSVFGMNNISDDKGDFVSAQDKRKLLNPDQLMDYKISLVDKLEKFAFNAMSDDYADENEIKEIENAKKYIDLLGIKIEDEKKYSSTKKFYKKGSPESRMKDIISLIKPTDEQRQVSKTNIQDKDAENKKNKEMENYLSLGNATEAYRAYTSIHAFDKTSKEELSNMSLEDKQRKIREYQSSNPMSKNFKDYYNQNKKENDAKFNTSYSVNSLYNLERQQGSINNLSAKNIRSTPVSRQGVNPNEDINTSASGVKNTMAQRAIKAGNELVALGKEIEKMDNNVHRGSLPLSTTA